MTFKDATFKSAPGVGRDIRIIRTGFKLNSEGAAIGRAVEAQLAAKKSKSVQMNIDGATAVI